MLVVALVVLACGFALLVTWKALAPPSTPAQAQPAGENTQQVSVTRVVDGDTIEVTPQVEGTADVRLIGVDTPETVAPGEPVEPCGPEASAFTEEQLEGEDVILEFDEERIDPNDRALAYVWVPDLEGELFNETRPRRPPPRWMRAGRSAALSRSCRAACAPMSTRSSGATPATDEIRLRETQNHSRTARWGRSPADAFSSVYSWLSAIVRRRWRMAFDRA
jgi:hypothetical protein